jgi:hypothetical protein
MIGFVENVRSLIIIGVKHVRNVANHIHPVILFQAHKTGNVPSAVILITLVEWNAIVVNTEKMIEIDFVNNSKFPLFSVVNPLFIPSCFLFFKEYYFYYNIKCKLI